MSDETHERGMRRAARGARRRRTSTAPIARTTPFTADFQDLITRYAWGEIWARPGLDRRTRSAITLDGARRARARARARDARPRGAPQRADRRTRSTRCCCSAPSTAACRQRTARSRSRSACSRRTPDPRRDPLSGAEHGAGERHRNVARMAALPAVSGAPTSARGPRGRSRGATRIVPTCARPAGAEAAIHRDAEGRRGNFDAVACRRRRPASPSIGRTMPEVDARVADGEVAQAARRSARPRCGGSAGRPCGPSRPCARSARRRGWPCGRAGRCRAPRTSATRGRSRSRGGSRRGRPRGSAA